MWNRNEQDFNWIPERFDEKQEIDWTAAWSLTEERVKYVPTAYCYYGYPPAAGHDFCRADSNGNAAGNTREEAVLQGFLELVERDSVALWWYNRARRPAIQLDSFDHPYFQALPRFYRQLGREIWVLDITGDLDIPAFAAVSPRKSRKKNDMMLGFGAHLNPEIALSRALTEMNQFLPAIIDGKPPRMTSEPLSDDAFCRPDTTVPARHLREFRRLDKGGLRENIKTCVKLARRRKIEVLILDQTRSDVGLPVVKVVAPGLRQFWARFAPGRLYETPVRMGWLNVPLKEEQLNTAHLIM
jgi:ribosomal protein S12 methylthiotransferase accessory factor